MTDPLNVTGMYFPTPQEAPPTPEEAEEIQARLWTLLTKQVRLYTQGDHSSLREEEAAELLQSLIFSLQTELHKNGLPMRALLTCDLAAMLKAAQHTLHLQVQTADTLYRIALRSVAVFGSCSLTDTLEGIGQFFRLYDIRLHAHQIPASIDYPLCVPVPETLRGVLYIRAYLDRLLLENKLITRFAPARVTALLERSSPDYRELLQNLYEPVAANVVGLSLLGGGEALLEISDAQAVRIHTLLASLPEAQAYARLSQAAHDACGRLKLAGEDSVDYLAQAAQSLYPRLVLSPESAAGVFPACGNPFVPIADREEG